MIRLDTSEPTVSHAYEQLSITDGTPLVTLDELKVYLRAPVDVTDQDTFSTAAIKTATLVAELVTRRTIFPREFRTFRDRPVGGRFSFRKTPFTALTSAAYIKSGETAYTTISLATILSYLDGEYPVVWMADGWPTDFDQRHPQPFRFTFTAGSLTVGTGLKEAVLAHAAAMYENRGSCDCDSAVEGMLSLPAQCKTLYQLNRVFNLHGALLR